MSQMSVKQRNTLASFGYIRHCSNIYSINIPIEIIQLITTFYGAAYQIYARGWNYRGEWGLSTEASLSSKSLSYIQLLTMHTLITEPSDIHYCGGKIFIKAQSTVYAAGENTEHRLGLATSEERVRDFYPLTFPDIDDDDYIDIMSNGHNPRHTLFITNKSKTVYGIGKTLNGVLGGYQIASRKIEQISSIPSLTVLCATDNIIKIECGSSHTLMLSISGKVFCCGTNSNNQCGLEVTAGTENIITPTLVVSHIIDISVGNAHSLCLSNKGELYVFGENRYQQLGIVPGAQSALVKCPYFNDNKIVIKMIVAGGWHNIVMDDKGMCWGFGWSSYSQLGLTTSYVAPVVLEISSNEAIEGVYCGPWHSALLTKTNQVYTFGYNGHNECSILLKQNKVHPPYWLKREEIGLSEECVIDTVITGYQSTLIVTRD